MLRDLRDIFSLGSYIRYILIQTVSTYPANHVGDIQRNVDVRVRNMISVTAENLEALVVISKLCTLCLEE